MLTGRDALRTDEPRLTHFRCRNAFHCADEVEEYVQSALDWRASTPGTHVKVFYDDGDPSGQLLAVAGYAYLTASDPRLGVYIAFLGVAADSQERGVGSEALRMILDLLGEQIPGASVSWRVHVRNRPSQSMVHEVVRGIEPTYPPEYPGYLEYSVEVEPAQAELPLGDEHHVDDTGEPPTIRGTLDLMAPDD
jgi:ribosomal protein S18 acetylase RimI-like enzyme